MKKETFNGRYGALSVFAMTLTSCSDDNDSPANGGITFSEIEIGHDNSKVGTIGDDIHLECKNTVKF